MVKNAVIELDEGDFIIEVSTLKKDEDEPSAMAAYLGLATAVAKKDGIIHLTVRIADNEIIKGFQIENDAGELVEAIGQQVDEEGNQRAETFELSQLKTQLNVQVQYAVSHGGQVIKGDEALRLVFDKMSLTKQ